MTNKAQLLIGRASRLGALALVTLGLVVGTATAPASALPATDSPDLNSILNPAGDYVALGDSFTGGQGAPPYEPGPCLRSRYASYPDIAAALSPYRLVDNKACTGATIDITLAQLSGVSPTTDLVTLTVGGIDAGSNQVLGACAPDPASPVCAQAIEASIIGLPALTPRLAALYSTIAATLPEARVVVVGYPLLFQPGLFPTTDLYNSATQALNAVIQGAVAAAGNPRITYTDVTEEFAGHGIGSPVPYITFNPRDPASPANFHPNHVGNALGYARALVNDGVLFPQH
jgi:lysophospholipase L1-like esterase